MPTKVVFADKLSEDVFWALQTSNQSHKSGNHPSLHLVSTQPVNRNSVSYSARSLFAKFNASAQRRSTKPSRTLPLAARPQPKQQWWCRRRAANKVKSKSFADRTIVSPFEEMALYGFVTPVDLLEENETDDDSAPTTVTELQQWHDDHVASAAMYTPWDVSYGIDRSTRALHAMQEQCVPGTNSMHSPWEDKPGARRAAVETSANKVLALCRTNSRRRYHRQEAS